MSSEDSEEEDRNTAALALVQAGKGTVTKPTVAKEDLLLVSQWAKTNLFEKVKFLYNPDKDLQVNGRLYKLFVNECKG